jgi:uncharacterized protein YbbC (DUF1343 family)
VFTPTEGKYAARRCHGVMLHVTDPSGFLPVATGWLLIRIIKELHPHHFQWAAYPTHVNPSGKKHLDLLSGISNAENLFDTALSDFISVIKTYTIVSEWLLHIQPYLMYA